MAMTWKDLAELRAKGQRPLLPVIVTTWPSPWRPHARELFDRGVMVVTHEAGKPIPARLLEGLDVILALENCGQTTAVCALMRSRGVKATVHGWCACYREFTSCPAPCKQTHEQVSIVESCRAA
jgi:hypothetical protein